MPIKYNAFMYVLFCPSTPLLTEGDRRAETVLVVERRLLVCCVFTIGSTACYIIPQSSSDSSPTWWTPGNVLLKGTGPELWCASSPRHKAAHWQTKCESPAKGSSFQTLHETMNICKYNSVCCQVRPIACLDSSQVLICWVLVIIPICCDDVKVNLI